MNFGAGNCGPRLLRLRLNSANQITPALRAALLLSDVFSNSNSNPLQFLRIFASAVQQRIPQCLKSTFIPL